MDIVAQQQAIAVSTRNRLAREIAPKVKFIDLWNSPLFAGGLNKFIVGQNTATLGTTAASAVGATTITLSSVTGVTAGVCLITAWGSATQQVHRVVSVAGNVVTVADPLVTALGSNQSIASFWTSSAHLTTGAGFLALAYYIANAKDSTGAYIIPSNAPKVTFLGNSWWALIAGNFATYLAARGCTATVVNVGVGGNTSAQMLARFGTDVPVDSSHVVFFEHVNDWYQNVTVDVQFGNFEQIAARTRAIGAVPIIIGPVPLADYATGPPTQAADFPDAIGDGAIYPGTRMSTVIRKSGGGQASLIHTPGGSSNIGVGPNTLNIISTGGSNSALGEFALKNVTTGSSNVGVGRQAGQGVTTGSQHTLVGQGAGYTIGGGVGITAVGQLAAFLCTASNNTMIGQGSGYAPNAVTANASTSGTGQTLVGVSTGQGSTTASNYITCLGMRTVANGDGGVAIGVDSGGAGASATAANEIALGTANHTTKIRGRFNLYRITPTSGADAQGQTGDVTSDDSYVYAKTGTGWKRAAVTTW